MATLDGKSTEDYAQWITDPFNWGGEIELGILAAHFEVELCVVSMVAFYILPFSMGTKGRCYLLYTGQHYDPLVGASCEDANVETETRLFPPLFIGNGIVLDPLALACARMHAAISALNASRRMVEKIKCGGCGALVDDSAAFQQHCEEVEHDDDFCYDCTAETVVEEGGDAVPLGRIDLTSPGVLAYYNTPSSPFSTLHDEAPFQGPPAGGGAVGGGAGDSGPSTTTATTAATTTTYPTVEHWCLCHQFSGDGDARHDARLLREPTSSVNMLATQLSGSEVRAWGVEAREAVLKAGIRAQLGQHAGLREQLVRSGAKTLVLVDVDKVWGMSASGGIPTGQNRAGKCLMEVRAEITSGAPMAELN